MQPLPVRGPGARELGLPLPPARMPLVRRGRPLKRWRYVGVYGPELMLCVADARVGGIPQRWWAVALPDGTLHERTTAARGGVEMVPGRVRVDTSKASIDIEIREGDGIEVVSPHGRSYIWTRKQAGIPARGRVAVNGRQWDVDGEAFVDESAGYHARRTSWRWSAGMGRTDDGRRLGWNLVAGVHDGDAGSERTLWIDGEPRETGPVTFADDLSCVSLSDGGVLRCNEWCRREDHTNRLLFRSDYRQPFGSFGGELPGGLRVAEGFGVMEEHDVRW
jgi:hypothetical protein